MRMWCCSNYIITMVVHTESLGWQELFLLSLASMQQYCLGLFRWYLANVMDTCLYREYMGEVSVDMESRKVLESSPHHRSTRYTEKRVQRLVQRHESTLHSQVIRRSGYPGESALVNNLLN